MKKITLFIISLFFVMSSFAEVVATWSIEEGAVLESFTDVTVTFSGIDPLGRKIDGTEVTRVLPGVSGTPTFFVVNEDGTTTPVVADENDSQSGVLSCSSPALIATLSLGTDRYTLVDGAFLKNGNYRIVLPANKVQYQPKVDNAPVYGDKDFVLNFSIVNDIEEDVKLEELDAVYTVDPENNAVVKSLTTVVLTFTDVTNLTLGDLGAEPNAKWAYCNKELKPLVWDSSESHKEVEFNPVAPMLAKVEGNKLILAIMEGYEKEVVEAGNYSITIPSGIVLFDETHTNKAITLNYTLEPEEVESDVDYVAIDALVVENGTISYNGEFQIFTITGQNVTAMNGSLVKGVYVVRTSKSLVKVFVK